MSNLYTLGSSDFLSDLCNKLGQRGTSFSSQTVLKLNKVFKERKVIKCHDKVMAIVLKDGSLHTFGAFPEMLGHSSESSKVSSLETITVKTVEVGGTQIFAMDDVKRLYAWGNNMEYQLGFNETTNILKPKLLRSFPPKLYVSQIACGYAHTLFLLSDGSIWSAGNNEHGQLGLGHEGGHHQLKQISSIFGIPFTQVTAGYHHSLALTMSGKVFAWGNNSHGQLGLGDTRNKYVPHRLTSLKSQPVKHVAAGLHHSVVLTTDGGVFTFGSNGHGQLGHGMRSGDTSINPRKVFELMGSNVTQVSCGKNHTLAFVAEQSQVYTFGDNSASQLGYEGVSEKNYLPSLIPGPWSSSRRKPNLSNTQLSSNSNSVVMRDMLTGGNCSIIDITDDLSFSGCSNVRVHNPLRKISYLSEELIESLSQASDESVNSSELRYIEELEIVIGSQSCLNSSFLATDHDKTSASYSGISMMGARLGFSKLASSRCHKVEQVMMKALVSSLIPSLTENPPDVETLRLYVFLIECPLLQRKENFASLTYPFICKLLGLAKNPGLVLNKWYRVLEPMYFMKMLEIAKTFLLELFNKPQDYGLNIDMLKKVLDFMAKIYSSNSDLADKEIIPYQKFYVQDIDRMVNFENDYLQYVKESSASSKPIFCHYPFLLDSTVKTEILKMDAQFQMRVAYNETQQRNLSSLFGFGNGENYIETPRLELEVRRDDIVNNTLNQLSQLCHQSTYSLKKPLLIKFQGEEGEDAGGVRKEFFLLILREILDPKYGMFRTYEESGLIWFADIQLESDDMYYLVGVICGLAIYNNTIIDICFPLALYRKLLGDKVGMLDLKELDPVMYRSFQQLLDYDEDEQGASVKDVFCLTFSVDKDNFGEQITIDLIEDGSNVAVTNANRREYVNAYIDHLFNTSVHQQFSQFMTGFHKVCGGHVLNLFRPTELMEMVIGNQDYNWDDFEKTAEYKGVYYRQHPVIDRFWIVFHHLSLEDKKNFLLFLTGSNKVPINGVKITIQSVSLGDEHLPVAHTCFNLLDLPAYSSVQILNDKLLKAILYNQGFHLV